ncbi:MAG: hypothetical protein ABI067_08345 [Leifsonia sp.]
MKTTAKQAQATKVYFIDYNDMTIDSDSLYNFVMESAEETTSPRGVMNKLFLQEKEIGLYQNIDDNEVIIEKEYNELNEKEKDNYKYLGNTVKYQVRYWMGSQSKVVEEFDSEEDAEDLIFERTYDFDFMPDDQRNTNYFLLKEEAEQDLAERISEQE